ncbi:MAG: hypothetical protein ABDH21_01950 [bacterium]
MIIGNNSNITGTVSSFHLNMNTVNINVTNININSSNSIDVQNDIRLRMQLQWVLIQLLMALLGGEGTDEWNRLWNDYGGYFNHGMGNILERLGIPSLSSPVLLADNGLSTNVSNATSNSPYNVGINHNATSSSQSVTGGSQSVTSGSQGVTSGSQSAASGSQGVTGGGQSANGSAPTGSRPNYASNSPNPSSVNNNNVPRNNNESDSFNYHISRGSNVKVERSGQANIGNLTVKQNYSVGASSNESATVTSTRSRSGLYGRAEINTEANAGISGSTEIRLGDKAVHARTEAKAGTQLQGKAEGMIGKGAYGEVGLEANLKASFSSEVGAKHGDAGVSVGVKGEAGATAKAGLKFGVGIGRDNDEIVAKAGLHAGAEANLSASGTTTIRAENSDGYIQGSLGLSGNVGVGGTLGFGTEARVDTNSWNVNFSTVIQLGFGIVFGFDGDLGIQGQISINREISELRNELNQQIKQEEQKLLQNEINRINSQGASQVQRTQSKPTIDRNKIRQQARSIVLNNVPNWRSRLDVVKRSFDNKARNIFVDFANKTLEEMARRKEQKEASNKGGNNIWQSARKTLVGVTSEGLRALKGANSMVGALLSLMLNSLVPSIKAAIYSIRPQDVVKG